MDKVLTRLLPGVPRSRIFRLVRRGEVRVNGRRAGPELRLAAGDSVRLPPVREVAPDAPRHVPAGMIEAIERAIIHEDERLLVLDKPGGMAVHGGSGLSFGVIEALRASRPSQTLELAHRLDRDTSGLSDGRAPQSALRALHALLRDGEVQKSYLALWPAAGIWGTSASMRRCAPICGSAASALSRWTRTARSADRIQADRAYGARASLLEAVIHTGRTHQIRVHAALLRPSGRGR